MRNMYIAIVLLVLYGDLLKRVVSPQLALMVLYGLAILILAVLVRRNRFVPNCSLNRDGRLIQGSALFLVAIYATQLMTAVENPLKEGLTHTLYISIPLLYIVVIQRYCATFDLIRLAQVFLICMIPVNLVGLIQYTVNPDFMVSHAYSEDGGVMIRNLLFGGTFARFPSIFSSADRYSSMALFQFYFSLVAMSATGTSRSWKWIAFNLLSSVAALFIAGTRSRIMLAALLVLLMAITAAVKWMRSPGRLSPKFRARLPVYACVVLACLLSLFVLNPSTGQKEISESVPVVEFLQQSIEKGDIGDRIQEAIEFSQLPDDATLFGKGLGMVGVNGKPAEFGVRSLWQESGLVWGGLILIGFLGLCLVLWHSVIGYFLKLQPFGVALHAMPLLLITMALLAGLTAAFELSTGLLLACSVAAIARVHGPQGIVDFLLQRVRAGMTQNTLAAASRKGAIY